MPPTVPSPTISLSFNDVVARLAAHPAVDGLLTIGSKSQNMMTPSSDYDLIVILREAPVPLRVALTYIGDRLTDVIFVDATEIARVLGEVDSTVRTQWDEAQVLRWLRTGQVMFDRSGSLQRAQVIAKSAPERGHGEGDLYSAWFSINYNLRQSHRMLLSGDPVYQMAVDLRLLYSVHDLWRYYFAARQLPVYGEKEQIRYLDAHDPEYLQAFRDCLSSTNRNTKFQLYEQLAERTIAPVGRLWKAGVTSVLPDPSRPWKPDTAEAALTFWVSLVRSPTM